MPASGPFAASCLRASVRVDGGFIAVRHRHARVQELSDEECWLLAANDTWRYVIFPSGPTPSCCKYCNVSQYCGIVKPDWLQDNSTYVGRQNISGLTCDGWKKDGGEENYW